MMRKMKKVLVPLTPLPTKKKKKKMMMTLMERKKKRMKTMTRRDCLFQLFPPFPSDKCLCNTVSTPLLQNNLLGNLGSPFTTLFVLG